MRYSLKTQLMTMVLSTLSLASLAHGETTTPEAQSAAQQVALPAGQTPVVASTIVSGTYRDHKQDLDLYIKEVGSTHYAVIVWKAQYMSLFRIEEIDASTQAWVQLIQGQDNVLTTEAGNQATYAVTQIRTGKELTLRFNWTKYASTLGPNVLCTIIPTFKLESTKADWISFAQVRDTHLTGSRNRRSATTVVQSESRDGRRMDKPVIEKNPKDSYGRKLEVILTNAGLPTQWNLLANNLIIESANGRAFVSKKADFRTQQAVQFAYNGDFRGEEVIPGLMLVRQRELDPTSGSGLKIQREVSFFAVSLSNAVQVMAMPPGARDCAYVRNELK